MKQFEGFKSEARAERYPMLPAGAYVCGIKNVKIEGQEPDQQLILRLEIVEGEYTGYYTKRYENDSQNTSGLYSAKYKGDYKLQIPNPNNLKRQHPEWDVKTFNNAMYCIEASNPGYHWNWNEAGLKGKMVGINVREGVYNGNPYTQIGRLETVDDVRGGKVKPMKPKEDTAPAVQAVDPSGFAPVEVDELPF